MNVASALRDAAPGFTGARCGDVIRAVAAGTGPRSRAARRFVGPMRSRVCTISTQSVTTLPDERL